MTKPIRPNLCYCGKCKKCEERKLDLLQRIDWWQGPMESHGYGK